MEGESKEGWVGQMPKGVFLFYVINKGNKQRKGREGQKGRCPIQMAKVEKKEFQPH